MEELYQNYKDTAAIYIVYVAEAHAADDRFPVGYAKDLGINEPTTYGQRCTVASRLVSEKKLTIPCLIDGMDNGASKAYQALPDRVFLIGRDGKLAIAGNRGPWGFAPALAASEKWLAAYKSTGVDPPPVELEDVMGKTRELSRKMGQAYQDRDYAEAIQYAEQIHNASPKRTDAIYNLACFHCLNGDHEKAFTWIEKAIDAGYDEADHMIADDDFKAIRDTERFQSLVGRVRAAKSGVR